MNAAAPRSTNSPAPRRQAQPRAGPRGAASELIEILPVALARRSSATLATRRTNSVRTDHARCAARHTAGGLARDLGRA
jgi:hypothetical protein